VRHRAFFNPNLRFLFRKSSQEQYIYRINVAIADCILNGSCVVCGCATPALMFRNKTCDAFCYPDKMSTKKWEKYKTENLICPEKYNNIKPRV